MKKFYSIYPSTNRVRSSAAKAGDRCLSIISRSSSRSATGWVIEAEFTTYKIARRFKAVWFSRIEKGFPFIHIRNTECGWSVSIPCSVPELACGFGKRYGLDPMSREEFKTASPTEKEANNARYRSLKAAKAALTPIVYSPVAVLAGKPVWLGVTI